MKKNVFFVVMISALMMACQSGQKGAQTQSEDNTAQVDYDAVVKEGLPSMEEFLNIVDGFQRGTKELLPTGTVWDNIEKEIRTILGSKGFTVDRDKQRVFFISATKNCVFNVSDDYLNSSSITPSNTDSLAVAYYFFPMGDMYNAGEILLADTCVYDALVAQILSDGYKPLAGHTDEWGKPTTEEKYEKENPQIESDCYYFLCDHKKKRISLHYDFMEAQEIR
jgi:hypothetical protein